MFLSREEWDEYSISYITHKYVWIFVVEPPQIWVNPVYLIWHDNVFRIADIQAMCLIMALENVSNIAYWQWRLLVHCSLS